MGGHSVLVATSLVIFVFSVLPVEGRRRMQRYEELDEDDDIIDNTFEDDEDALRADDLEDEEDDFGEDEGIDISIDEEEEPEIDSLPHITQAEEKRAPKQPPEGRLSARKKKKRRKSRESIFQHKYGKKNKKSRKEEEEEEEEEIFPDVHLAHFPPKGRAPQDNLIIEYTFATIIVLYILTIFNGWRSNETIARMWYQEFEQLFEKEFVSVGIEAGLGTDDNLVKESMDCFNLYASGRQSCKGLLCTLNLKMRQDLVSVIWNKLNPSTRDHLIVEVPMDDNTEDFVLMVANKKSAKQKRANSPDLAANRRVRKLANGHLPSNLVAYSDCPETVIKLLSTKKRILAMENPLFQWLHVTDSASESDRQLFHSRKCLLLKFSLPPSSEMQKLRPLLQMTFELIDALASMRLSDAGKKKTVAIRKQLNQLVKKARHAERQELAQQKMLLKIQRQKQRYENMTPKQRAKADAQEEKRKRKKAMKRAKGKGLIRVAR